MKTIVARTILFFALLVLQKLQAQDSVINWRAACYYVDGMQGDSLCENERSYLADPNQEANEVLLKVVSVVGLRPNFTLESCNGIKNCIATIGTDRMRYIIYDKDFIHQLSDTSKTNWAFLSIFAHEVLHHLNGHTFSPNRDKSVRRSQELEADEWSGRICASLGATLEEAQMVMKELPDVIDENNSDHPSKAKRLAAIEEGYNNAITRKLKPREVFTSVDDITLKRNGFKVVESLDSLRNFIDRYEVIQRVQFIDNRWYVFYTKDSSKPFIDFAFTDAPPVYEIYDRSKQGKQVKYLDFQNNKWIVMFEENPSKKNEFLKKFTTFNITVADSLFKKGLIINEISYGQNEWLVMLDSAAGHQCADQLVIFDTEYPFDDIKSKIKKPEFFEISTAKYINHQWITVLQKFQTEDPVIAYFQSKYSTFRIEQMIEGDIKNYKITQAGFDGRNWVFVMKKTKNLPAGEENNLFN